MVYSDYKRIFSKKDLNNIIKLSKKFDNNQILFYLKNPTKLNNEEFIPILTKLKLIKNPLDFIKLLNNFL